MAAHAKDRNRTDENRRDLALVQRAQAGDLSATGELWDLYHTEFRPWVHRWNRIDEWENLFVDGAASQLVENLQKYQPGLSAFRSWAFSVARNAVLKLVRELDISKVEISLSRFFEDDLPALFGPLDGFVRSRVHEEVDRLEREQRAAVRGHFFEGRTDEEIGAELGIDPRRVSYRRMQGMKEIARRLRDVPFTLIRPETRFSGYYYTMTNQKRNPPAQPGGKEGDYA